MFPVATSSTYRRHADESDLHGNGLGEFGGLMKSSIVKRSVVIGGHKTSVSLEEPFWTDLKRIAHTQHVTLSVLVTQIDDTRRRQRRSRSLAPHRAPPAQGHKDIGQATPAHRGSREPRVPQVQAAQKGLIVGNSRGRL